MTDRILVQREAARSALQLRRSRSIPRENPINVYDLAVATGVQVQFLDLRSLEGMFYRGPDPKIILPSLNHRSRGRISFSCAHELGHFQLGHGTRVDKYLEQPDGLYSKPDEEIAADTFASTLLMPRPAILRRFECRGVLIDAATPVDIFTVACELDVGYVTLLNHMRYGLELVEHGWFIDRKKVTPKSIREQLVGRTDIRRAVIIDQHWPDVPIDLEVGDYLVASPNVQLEAGGILEQLDLFGKSCLVRASRPGTCQINLGRKLQIVRIARSGFVGLFQYRHLEDIESE